MSRILRNAIKVATIVGVVAVTATISLPALAAASPRSPHPRFSPYLSQFSAVNTLASMVPLSNGDLNPYGIATVPQTVGRLVEGDTIVSNFNASSNLQGTGTTIVQISPDGHRTLFARLGALPGACPGGVGLTTALSVVGGDFVVVGSLPVSYKGTTVTPHAGCLIVLNSEGVPVETFSGGPINGPWDMTTLQFPGFAELFVTNVLNGTAAAKGAEVDEGTVIRLDLFLPTGQNPVLIDTRVIGTGFPEQLNNAALVFGPTGVALGFDGTLYVADTVKNRIAEIPFAPFRGLPVLGGGGTLTSGGSLNGPLGMTLAPNGDLITVNGGDGNAVETTPWGTQVDTVQIDPFGTGGDLFGLTIAPDKSGVLFVDDGDNTLKVFH